MNTKKAFIRRPSPLLDQGLVSHIEKQPVDADLAMRQWQAYVDVLQGRGWETVEVPPADECPDSVFVEDTMVVYGDLAVMANPIAPSRRAEIPAAEMAARAVGYRVARITAPGHLDGGDVLKHDNTVWVGRSGRTNDDGIRQLAEHLAPLGARVVPVPLTKVLHLKSAVTALPDGTVVGFLPHVDDPSIFPSFLEVPEDSGAHVVILDDKTLLMAASAPETAALYRDRGYEVIDVDISEFEKLEGCVTCLSVRLRGLSS